MKILETGIIKSEAGSSDSIGRVKDSLGKVSILNAAFESVHKAAQNSITYAGAINGA